MTLRASLLALALIVAARGDARADTTLPIAHEDAAGNKIVTLASGLRYVDLRVGAGAEMGPKGIITVHYVGRLVDGTEIDNSRRRGEPASFHLGEGQLIKGWELGVPGMRVGGIRRLMIPAALAYGDRARTGSIPAGSNLTFDVELLAIK
jgi:peptidylprolyl isomerase